MHKNGDYQGKHFFFKKKISFFDQDMARDMAANLTDVYNAIVEFLRASSLEH